jgi:hypothetical protein
LTVDLARLRGWPRLLLAAAAALSAAACNPFQEDTSALPCPVVRVLGAGERYVRYAEGAAAEPANLELEARFLSAESSCEYDDDEDPQAGMVLDLSLVIAAERGPAAGPAAVERLPYFVAILGPDRTIVTRKEFVAEIPPPEEGQQFALTEPEEISLTFPAGGTRAPWEFEVVVSFQLTRAQLDLIEGPAR